HRRQADPLRDRPAEGEHDDREEDRRRDQAAVHRAAPAWGAGAALERLSAAAAAAAAALRARAHLRPRLVAALRLALGLAIDATALGAAMLAAAPLGHGGNLVRMA